MLPSLFATSWVDVGIPGVIGLLLLLFPQWAMKKTGSEANDAAREAMARKGGAVLLVVAVIYYFTTSHA